MKEEKKLLSGADNKHSRRKLQSSSLQVVSRGPLNTLIVELKDFVLELRKLAVGSRHQSVQLLHNFLNSFDEGHPRSRSLLLLVHNL